MKGSFNEQVQDLVNDYVEYGPKGSFGVQSEMSKRIDGIPEDQREQFREEVLKQYLNDPLTKERMKDDPVIGVATEILGINDTKQVKEYIARAHPAIGERMLANNFAELNKNNEGVVAAYDAIKKDDFYKIIGEKRNADEVLVRNFHPEDPAKYELADHISREVANKAVDIPARVQIYNEKLSELVIEQGKNARDNRYNKRYDYLKEQVKEVINTKVKEGSVLDDKLKDELKNELTSMVTKTMSYIGKHDGKAVPNEKEVSKAMGAVIREAAKEEGMKLSLGQKISAFLDDLKDKFSELRRNVVSEIVNTSGIKEALKGKMSEVKGEPQNTNLPNKQDRKTQQER